MPIRVKFVPKIASMPPTLPPEFESTMQSLLGPEYPAFLEALAAPPPVSIRYNFQKVKKWEENFEGVKWCSSGVYLPERPVFTLDPTFHAGAYYVQEASSMLIETAVRQLADPNRPLRVLDLAAAPGGKSTLLANILPEGSFLLANEVIRNRYQTLRYNLVKWGQPHVFSSNHDPRELHRLEGYFDLLLLDAPCSGEGLFRKDTDAAGEWSPEHVRHCALRQQRILQDAIPLIKPGGILLYSTCTYNALENEHNAAWALDQYPLETAPLDLPAEWGIESREIGYQCYPHRVRGEGFYLACFRKTGGREASLKPARLPWAPLSREADALVRPWLKDPEQYRLLQTPDGRIMGLPAALEASAMELRPVLRRWQAAFEIGQIKGKQLVPSPDLALHSALHPHVPSLELDRDLALRFLRKDDFPLPIREKGWFLIRYRELGLGWIKALGNRFNNYYPQAWRIRMEV